MSDLESLKILWNAAAHSTSELIAFDSVELAEDLEIVRDGEETSLAIRRPLRFALSETCGTLVFCVRPLQSDRNSVELWTCGEELLADHFQVMDQRMQNYEPNLRRMPGQYRLSAWEKEEWDAVSPTEIRTFYLPPEEWATLVITWEKDGDELGNTYACINGMPVSITEGIPAWLRLTQEDCESEQSFAGGMYWQRAALLSGVELRSCLLADWTISREAALKASRSDSDCGADILVSDSAGTRAPQDDDITDIVINVTDILIDAVDCEPVSEALPLDVRNADIFQYWHYEASECTNKTALACIPDDEPLRYHFHVVEDWEYWLVLRYQLILPPEGASPCVRVEFDQSCPRGDFEKFDLPSTTASGSMRPEPDRYKEIRIGSAPVRLNAGPHEIALTFTDNSFLILDSIRLTIDAVPENPSQDELTKYRRPPAMEVREIVENETETVYRLAFINLHEGPQAGRIRIDDASDPGKTPELSEERLDFESKEGEVEIDLLVPVESEQGNPRCIRLSFVDEPEWNRMGYIIRHRRPFHKPPRPRRIASPNLTGQPLPAPADEEGLARRIEEIRQNPELASWLATTPAALENEPMPVPGGHPTSKTSLMIELAHLSEGPDVLERLRATLLANARAVVRLTFRSPDGERRAGVRSDYYNFRFPRGGLYGELAVWEIVAYDILLSAGILSHEDQAVIETNLFWSTYENSKRWQGGEFICRGQAHMGTASAFLGAALEDEMMLQECEETMRRYGFWQILADGGHNEKISSYGGGWGVQVEVALFLREIGRPRLFDECRERIRNACKSFARGCFSNGSLLRQGNGGIQRSFHILSMGRYFKIARELFPEDPEFAEICEYDKALGKRLWAKWDHQPPEEWPALPDRLLRKSDLFPDSGWSVLRSAPGKDRMEASLDWSAFGDHGHPDKLHMNLLAFDEVMNEDLSYGWYPQKPRSQRYAMRTISHSLVVSNMRCQLSGSKGRLHLFDHQDDVQVAWADAGLCYEGGVKADRCVVLLDDTVIDFFHIKGGKSRTFDWMFHCHGKFELPEGFIERGPLAQHARPGEKVSETPGYEFLEDLKELSQNTPMRMNWHLTGYPHMPYSGAEKRWMDYELGKLWLAFPQIEDTTYIIGKAPFPMPELESDRPFLMARRQARATCFAAVFQARTDERAPSQVRALPVRLRDCELASDHATAVEVVSEERSITVLQRHVSGPLSAGPIVATDADLVVCINRAGASGSLHAYGATYVELARGQKFQQTSPGNIHEELVT